MSDLKIKATFSVSRCSDGTISIRIVDENSGIEFVDASISPASFGEAITGLSSRPFSVCEVRGLEYIGKTRVTERRTKEFPGQTYDRQVLEKMIEGHCQEEGWLVSSYLGSQHSISYGKDADGKPITRVRYSVTKYVDQQENAT